MHIAYEPPCLHQRARAPFPRFYWPPNDEVKAWLESHRDEWVAAPPQWFTPRFVKRISTAAPPEVLPLAVLQDLAEEHSKNNVGQEDSSTSRPFATQSREKLVQMEKKYRANKAFARTKQLGIWAVALAFSYVDLGTTVMVGREYLIMGTPEGLRAAHVTFGMLGASLGLQALMTYLTGESWCIKASTVFSM